MRKKVGAIMAACLVATVISAIHPASASAQAAGDEGIASVSGNLVDTWNVVGGGLNVLIGPRTCTISADRPTRSANQVKGHGAVGCNRAWDLLTLQVCAQVRQAAAEDGGITWQPAGCQPLKQKRDASSLSDTATAQCVPDAAAYRTFTKAEGFRDDDDSEPAFSGIITSEQAIFDCSI